MKKLIGFCLLLAVGVGIVVYRDLAPRRSTFRTDTSSQGKKAPAARSGRPTGQPEANAPSQGKVPSAPSSRSMAATDTTAASPTPSSSAAPGRGVGDVGSAPARIAGPGGRDAGSSRPAGRYLPARSSSWAHFGLTTNEPLTIRAAGTVWTGNDRSGPDGITASNYERQLATNRTRLESDRRALPSAPYLALIARVCAALSCSEPFLVGSGRAICPGDTPVTGELQLWTNNYVRIDGSLTIQQYSAASGGFWFYAEPAAAGACSGSGAAPARSAGVKADIDTLAGGQPLRRPDFVVSSGQGDWKPFFLPLTGPLRVSASGEMRPIGGAVPTGPEGRVVPTTGRWQYPGTPLVFVDDTNRLFDPALPYLALIGRTCAGGACGRPFLVGADHVVCPAAAPIERLELWVNLILRPRGIMATAFPLSMEMLDMQSRSGEYRFEISRAPASTCGG